MASSNCSKADHSLNFGSLITEFQRLGLLPKRSTWVGEARIIAILALSILSVTGCPSQQSKNMSGSAGMSDLWVGDSGTLTSPTYCTVRAICGQLLRERTPKWGDERPHLEHASAESCRGRSQVTRQFRGEGLFLLIASAHYLPVRCALCNLTATIAVPRKSRRKAQPLRLTRDSEDQFI